MLWDLIYDFKFWGLFGGKIGMAGVCPKSWPTLESFWVTRYLKIVFPNFQTLDPALRETLKRKIYKLVRLELCCSYMGLCIRVSVD